MDVSVMFSNQSALTPIQPVFDQHPDASLPMRSITLALGAVGQALLDGAELMDAVPAIPNTVVPELFDRALQVWFASDDPIRRTASDRHALLLGRRDDRTYLVGVPDPNDARHVMVLTGRVAENGRAWLITTSGLFTRR